jgi:hypothetical protein
MPTVRSSLAFAGLILFLIVYAVAAVMVGDLLPDHWAADLVYYVAAGLAWIPVAIALLKWGYRTETR